MSSSKRPNIKLDKTYGEVFRNLRLSKNFSKDKATIDITSVRSLTNFENGDSMAGFDKVHKMLKNINVTLLEFDDAFNLAKHKQDILLYDSAISTAFLEHDVEKLKFMLSEIEHSVKQFKNVRKYQIDKWRIEAVLERLDPDYTMPEAEILLLRNYLINLKEWGLYDIHLFGYCVNVLIGDKDFEKLAEQMFLHTEETNNLHNIERAVIQTTLTCIDSCLSEKMFVSARRLINYLKKLKLHDYYMGEKLTLKYTEARLEYHRGKSSALEIMKKCQEVALFCNSPALANVIAQEISEIQARVENDPSDSWT